MSDTDTITSAAYAGLIFRAGLAAMILIFLLITLLLLFHRNYGKNVIARFTNNVNGKTMDISSWEVSIGRAKSCDIVLNYPTVSRFHAVVARRGKGWMIFDTGSKSGVYVNGEKIEKYAYIYDGDEIEMGMASLSFRSPLFRRPEPEPERRAAPKPAARTEPTQPKKAPSRAQQQSGTRKTPAGTPEATRRPAAGEKAQTKTASTPREKTQGASGAKQRPASQPGRKTGAYIAALRNRADRSLILLFANEYTVGRTQDCGITLPVMTVSRKHARLAKRDGRWTITDLDSKSGVFINGSKEKGTIYLYDKDVIDIGGVQFTYIEKYMEE